MKTAQSAYRIESRDITGSDKVARRAVGYIRVSTDMQAADGLSLDAQTAAIEQYCAMQGLKLVQIHKDVLSGGKSERPGLQEALRSLHRGVDVLVVLKFDRLSRSIRHFCELYETYFKSGEKELVAIRESIRLDSSLGRALVSILLVFAQMEREATAERTREALRHMKTCGYQHGKAPYGFMKVPRHDGSRYKILVENPEEQAVLKRIKEWLDAGDKVPDIAARLDAEGVPPPRSKQWNTSYLYMLAIRQNWHAPKPHNERPHSDDEVRARMMELRNHGHSYAQIASILNEQKWVPVKGLKFTQSSVGKLIRATEPTKYLTPKQYLDAMLRNMEQEHNKLHSDEPFKRPGFPRLAVVLKEAGYLTPKGHDHWWPAQVQQLLEGRFESYYTRSPQTD
jgi:DNA invertase Pin-like site-specific DNA recombinase